MRYFFIQFVLITLFAKPSVFGIKLDLISLILCFLLSLFLFFKKNIFLDSFIQNSMPILMAGIYFGLVTFFSQDWEGFGRIINIFITYISAFSFSYIINDHIIFKKLNSGLVYIYKSSLAFSVLNSSIIVLAFNFKPFSELLNRIFDRNTNVVDYFINLRVPGLSTSAGDGASLNYGLAILLSSFLLIEKKDSLLKYLYLIFLIVICLPLGLSARTGLFLTLLFLIMFFARSFFKQTIKSIRDLKFSKSIYIFLPIILSVITFILYFQVNQILFDEAIFNNFNNPLFRIARFLSGQDEAISTLSGRSYSFVENSSTLNLIFGTGKFTVFTKYGHLDPGLFRVLSAFGLIGIFLLISIYLYPIYLCFQRSIKNEYILHLIFLFLYGLISDFKIPYLSTLSYSFIYFTLVFILNDNRLKKIQRGIK